MARTHVLPLLPSIFHPSVLAMLASRCTSAARTRWARGFAVLSHSWTGGWEAPCSCCVGSDLGRRSASRSGRPTKGLCRELFVQTAVFQMPRDVGARKVMMHGILGSKSSHSCLSRQRRLCLKPVGASRPCKELEHAFAAPSAADRPSWLADPAARPPWPWKIPSRPGSSGSRQFPH